MAIIKEKGLVLKYSNINDNDRLFTIFFPESGKITAMSKGIRSHKHKDFSALQPFCYSDFVIDTSKGLGYITSAQVIENFYDLRTSVSKTSLASYITDIVSLISDEIAYDDDFFRFTLNTLFMISKISTQNPETEKDELIKLKAIYEMKTVCNSGYEPIMSQCSICGSAKELEYFDTYEGGIVCKNCHDSGHSPESVRISTSAYRMLSYICSSDFKSVFKFNASSDAVREASEICEKYLINKLEMVSVRLEYFKSIICS